MSKSKLFLIDGNGLAYRAFYAVPPSATSKGTPTNAVAGFFDMVIRLLAKEKPTHVAVAFDKGVPTERVSAYQDFNAHRVEMPDDLAAQLPTIEDVVRGMGLEVFRVRGHQGDDCLGTLAAQASKAGMEVLILSGDLDLLQLVGPNVQVMTFRRGMSDLIVYDEETVKRRFNLLPGQLADLRALAGDSSENITGVPGIGEVTAKKLLSQHGSLEELLNSLDQLPAKWRNPLSENRAEALDFRTRAAIRTDLELTAEWSRCEYRGISLSRIRDIFRRLELEELLDSLLQSEQVAVNEQFEIPEVEIWSGKKGKTALNNLVKKSKETLNLLFLGSGDLLVGTIIVGEDDTAKLIPFLGEDALTPEDVAKSLKPAFKDETRRKNVHNLRAFLMLGLVDGIDPCCNFFDVAIASHLIDSVEGNPWFDEICRRHGINIPGEGALLGRGSGSRKLSEVPIEELARWAGMRVLGLRRLAATLENRLRMEELWEQFSRVEMSLAWIFAQMEQTGVTLDAGKLKEFDSILERRVKQVQAEIQELARSKFDIDDPKELAEVLFDKMAIFVPSRPKNGAPIGHDVLAQVANQHPIGNKIRDYRELKELLQSFRGGLSLLEEPRFGWFHRLAQHPVASSERLLWMGPTAVGGAVATYNRLLSEVEALGNAEVRKELENTLLGALTVREKGKVLLGVSYVDLPLRLAAHFSQDTELVRGFVRGEDVESKLAHALGTNGDGAREAVEAVLGSIGAFRYAQSSGKSVSEAEEQIRNYLLKMRETFPNLARFFESQNERATTQGWVSSIRGRRRNLPELTSRNSDIRDTAERVARSAAIQASAADLLKAALVELYDTLKAEGLPARFALQLRDELILEIDPKQQSKILSVVEKVLHNRAKLDVPSRVRARVGKDLASAQELMAAASC